MMPERALLRSHLSQVPIFPLPSVVLLPYELVPLHVFEPRYRALVSDVLEQGRPIALTQLQPGWEQAGSRPPVEPICGVGFIARHERLPDGRFNLLMRGAARIYIDAEIENTGKPYREVVAHILDDDMSTASPEQLSVQMDQLRHMILSLVTRRPGPAAAQLIQSVGQAETAGELADIVAAALYTDDDLRRATLLDLDPSRRLDTAQVAVAELLTEQAGGVNHLPN